MRLTRTHNRPGRLADHRVVLAAWRHETARGRPASALDLARLHPELPFGHALGCYADLRRWGFLRGPGHLLGGPTP